MIEKRSIVEEAERIIKEEKEWEEGTETPTLEVDPNVKYTNP